MAKYEAKTKAGEQSVPAFLDSIKDEKMREDCKVLAKMMAKVTGQKPVLWGGTIVGFGSYHYKYDSGYEGDSCVTGFAPRKGNISIYTNLYLENDAPLMKNLGKFKNGKSCINIKKLSDVDMDTLVRIIEKGIEGIRRKYPSAT